MRAFAEVVRLELKALVRSKTVLFLLVAAAVWTLALPSLIRGDGTPDGARELYVHFSLGGVFALLVVSLLASATGSIARERAERRLQLTLVRPVRYAALILGKALAHVAVGAFVLAASAGILAARVDLSRPCSHVVDPILPPLSEAVAKLYEECMADTNTPAVVREAPRATVMRMLTARELDRYEPVAAKTSARWRFPSAGDAMRVRFSGAFSMRPQVFGEFRSDASACAVSNVTRMVADFPLAVADGAEVVFENRGATAVMLRPRRDVHLLRRADAFGWNLLRAGVVLVSVLSLVVAFGLFLGACLGRPVALFVAFVVLAVGEMSPSVIEQYPDELETDVADRIGLVISRTAAAATHPLTADSPLEDLARDVCVEPGRVCRLAFANLVVAPLAFALLGAFFIPRKQDDLA